MRTYDLHLVEYGPVVPTCYCGHAAQIHAPAPLDQTPVRGEGPCTARCWCDRYTFKENK